MNKYRHYMQIAIDEAKSALSGNDLPIAAVIVHKNQVIAQAHNQVETLKDPTAHAELLAIRQAIQILDTKYLSDCTIYVTLEPCPMCAGAIVLARIQELVFGASEPKTGACGSLYLIADDNRLNHQSKIIAGIMEQECSDLLKEYFRKLRTSNV